MCCCTVLHLAQRALRVCDGREEGCLLLPAAGGAHTPQGEHAGQRTVAVDLLLVDLLLGKGKEHGKEYSLYSYE